MTDIFVVVWKSGAVESDQRTFYLEGQAKRFLRDFAEACARAHPGSTLHIERRVL